MVINQASFLLIGPNNTYKISNVKDIGNAGLTSNIGGSGRGNAINITLKGNRGLRKVKKDINIVPIALIHWPTSAKGTLAPFFLCWYSYILLDCLHLW